MPASDSPIIARLKGSRSTEGAGTGCAILLLLGLPVIIVAAVLESSAIRLTAWAALWTGWNVLWGFCLLFNRPANYIVYRENPPAEH